MTDSLRKSLLSCIEVPKSVQESEPYMNRKLNVWQRTPAVQRLASNDIFSFNSKNTKKHNTPANVTKSNEMLRSHEIKDLNPVVFRKIYRDEDEIPEEGRNPESFKFSGSDLDLQSSNKSISPSLPKTSSEGKQMKPKISIYIEEEKTKGTENNFSPDIYRSELENVDETEEFHIIDLKNSIEEEKVNVKKPKECIFKFEKAQPRKFSNYEMKNIKNISMNLEILEHQLESKSCNEEVPIRHLKSKKSIEENPYFEQGYTMLREELDDLSESATSETLSLNKMKKQNSTIASNSRRLSVRKASKKKRMSLKKRTREERRKSSISDAEFGEFFQAYTQFSNLENN